MLNSLRIIFSEDDQKVFRKKLYSEKPFVWLKKTISPEQKILVKDIGQPGLYFGPRQMRIYPNGHLLAHTLGGTRYGFESVSNAEILGTAGIELFFNIMISTHEKTKYFLNLLYSISVDFFIFFFMLFALIYHVICYLSFDSLI